jgi:hypothetical protein
MVVANVGIVGKRTSEVVAVYLSPKQKELLEQWASKERRSVSNLVAGILVDLLIERFGEEEVNKP